MYISVAIGEKTETILSSLQACFVIAHSSGIFLLRIFVPSFIYFTNLHNKKVCFFSPLCHNFIQLNSVYLNMFCWCEWILTRLCTVELNNSARQMTHLTKEKRFRAQSGTNNSIITRSPFKMAKTEV